MDKRLFQIGEVARMYGVSVGTLRHYEQAGLLTPEYVDADTGYRYYGISQFEVLNTIRYLRALDMPLREISDFINNRDVDVIEDKLKRQKAEVGRRRRELERIEQRIDRRIAQIADARTSRLDTIDKCRLNACRMAVLRDSLRLNTYLDLEGQIRRLTGGQPQAMAFLGTIGVGISRENLLNGIYERYDTVFLLLEDGDEYVGNVLELPECDCLKVRFRGSHERSPGYYAALMDYARTNDLQVADFSREMTLIDYGMTNDTDKFVTEICLPVGKRQ